jgi:hypothetical protein
MRIQKVYKWYSFAIWCFWGITILLTICARPDLGTTVAFLWSIAQFFSRASLFLFVLPLQSVLFILALIQDIKHNNSKHLPRNIGILLLSLFFGFLLIVNHAWLYGGV